MLQKKFARSPRKNFKIIVGVSTVVSSAKFERTGVS